MRLIVLINKQVYFAYYDFFRDITELLAGNRPLAAKYTIIRATSRACDETKVIFSKGTLKKMVGKWRKIL